MNLGLGNRTTLRKFILSPALAATSSTLAPDASIDALGLGVARLFEKFCGRKFGRAAGDTVEFSGDRLSFVLPRYPVEAIASVEFRAGFTAAWSELSDVVEGFDPAAGLIQFASLPGNQFSALRVTYTGGYWFDDTEDATGVKPTGATALPEDLSLAWLMCCQEFWNKKDKLGLSLSSVPDTHVAIARLELPTGIKQMLAGHRRFQLS
jgi:hypothetical protein